MKTLFAFIRLARPVNLLIALFSVFIGGLVTGPVQPLAHLLAACVSAMLVMAGANAINDYYDLEIDRINKPRRPLPAGELTPGQARVFAMALFAAGTMLAACINTGTLITAALSSAALWLYSSVLKRTMIWGNFTVGLITGLAFVYGGMALGRTGLSLLVGLFAMLFHWGREIIKDMEDMEGDRSQGLRTLPLVKGTRAGLIMTTAVLSALIVLTLVPLLTSWFSPLYFAIVVPGVDLFLVYVLISAWRDPSRENMHRLAVLMKADMPVGLLAVFLGS